MSRRKKRGKIEFRYYQMPPGSPLQALLGEKWTQEYGREIDYLHFHNYLEIGYCYSGHGTLTLGERDLRFHGGEFSIIPKNFPHTTNSDPGSESSWEYLFVDVEGFLRHFYFDNPGQAEVLIQRINSQAMFLKLDQYPEIAKKILRILDIMRDTEEFYLEEAKGVLLGLLVSIARINRKTEEKEWSKGEELMNVVSKTLDYISVHYMEPLKVKDLADQVHISETHFRRIFTSYMKMGPLEYLNFVRVHVACDHLEKTEEPIVDVAHKCGFTTSSTFNRNFKQVMGVTPMEWIKRPENYERQLLDFDIHSEEGW